MNSRSVKQSIDDKQYYDNDDRNENNYKSSKSNRLLHERKFKQIDSADEEAQINRELRLQSVNKQKTYSENNNNNNDSPSSSQYRHHLRQSSSLVKPRKPIIIENVKLKSKLKRHHSVRSPRTSSSSFNSTSQSPVLSIEKKVKSFDFESAKNTKQSNNGSTQNLLNKYQELKNRLFLIEIELDNERKKANHEKEIKIKAISELKTRFEIEKKAALKALEAKLNAEKLEEFNKYKETAEIEKVNEVDILTKTHETELINLKLKLREKNEKCAKLESLIKEERGKFNQSHQKSFEVIEKYSNELKLYKATQILSNSNENNNNKMIKSSVDIIDRMIQTDDDNVVKFKHESSTQTEHNYSVIIERLKNLHKNLITKDSTISSKEDDLKLCDDIEEYFKKFNKRFDEIDEERRILTDNLEKTKKDLKQLKDSYKMKCKSDLDKSSLIKKLKIDYEKELMKLRNEENNDLVRHLEKQLSLKELQLMEQSYELETWRSQDSTINSINFYALTNSLQQDAISNSHNTFFNSSLNSNKIAKKVPVDILYTSDPDVVTSTNRRLSDDKDHKICLEKTKELQQKITDLEKELLNEKLRRHNITTTTTTNQKTNDVQLLTSNDNNQINKENIEINKASTTKVEEKEITEKERIEIEKLKSKLNQFSLQLATSTAHLIKQNHYQNTEELDKLLQQSNKEKLLLERQLAIKYSQLIQNQNENNNQQNPIKVI